ncbi:VWA domain-containing protein [uncultured Polaribacter sp.]|uniref:VWA domain-containing protein n=1 Tax=uncultured Polaribacter sp. TaxID=174711 RepID=UPI002637BF35|nr:VWA domain-containing protein [uncultured Polaribacter sp.]
MQTSLILYIILALLLSVSVAFLQYFYKIKKKPKVTILLFALKTFSLFFLILLLLNPKIEKTEIINEKPTLSILVDNSKSISFFEETENTKQLITKLIKNKELVDKFDIQEFSFGKNLQVSDSLSFLENNTNIAAALSSVNDINKNKIAPIILISDGNQTIGPAYEFINSKQTVYPVVIGDTTKYVDVKISQLNVNKYSYIKNKFPVEVILNYEGNENVTTQFSIFGEGKTLFREKVQFSSTKKSATLTTNLTSTKEGLQYYSASISKIDNEKNTKNNTKSFSVEVIDEQTKVLILTSILHPDIGALKKSIEINKQRTVDIQLISDFKKELNDYQLVILYQPNNKFNSLFSQLSQKNNNYFLISGANTDWNFLNQKQLGFFKTAINQTENYGAFFNENFLTFLQEDIDFNNFPPLKDKYGEIIIKKEHQILLEHSINGLQTKQPLLATIEQNDQKIAVLFGEGIWKWRSNSFLSANSFKDFDKFIGNLIQYLSSNKKRNRLEVNAKNLYPSNSSINISAFYTDKNYQFDARASLQISITNITTKEVTKIPFSLVNNAYQLEIENLNSGDYTYKVDVLGQKINKYGRFKITNYQIEEQFTNANVDKLEQLALKTSGKVFHKNKTDKLIADLLNNDSYFITQKSTVKQQNFIDWKWVLFLIIILLTVEWFIRKYHGKI